MGEHRKPKPWALIALAVAGCALAVDQFVLSASATAPADGGAAVAASASDDGSSVVAAPTGPTLAQHFERFRPRPAETSQDRLADAFGTPASLREAEPTAPGAEPVAAEVGLKLSSILTRDGERLAVVNGRPLRVGDQVDGATVSAIDEASVTMDTAIGPVTLRMERPTLGR
ncbi:MAG: hypothetical protein ACTS22_04980 [Phycisphaerales bacterium]